MNSLRTQIRRIPAPDPWLILLLVLCLPALAPLLASGYFYEAHDGRHSVFYQVMFDASLRDGALVPRWAMHHLQGYGYPTFVLLAPLGFYITELFVLLGAGFTTAARLAFATSLLGGAWGMYALLRYWLLPAPGSEDVPAQGNAGDASHVRQTDVGVRLIALVAALVYAYAPYRLLDIYVRGALNESLLLLWLPWLLLVFDRLLAKGATRGWQGRLVLATATLAATWLTHSFAIFFVTPLLVVFILFRMGARLLVRTGRNLRAFWQTTALAASAGVGALLLIAFFLLPLLAENRYLDQQVYTSAGYDYRNHFVQVGQFVSPFWGYGYSNDALVANDGMGFQVGTVAALLALVASLVVRRARHRGLMLFLLVASASILLLMTPLSAPLWDAIPLLAVIQFPWRLLLLVACTLSALAGLTLAELTPGLLSAARTLHGVLMHQEAAGVLLIGVMTILATAAYADPALQPVEPWREDGRAVYRFEEQFPDMITGTIWTEELFTTSPMSADYADPAYREEHGYTTDLTRLSIVQGEGEVLQNLSAGSHFGGVVNMQSAGVVRVNLLDFPGWKTTLDGEVVATRTAAPYGLIDVDVPAGEHVLEVRMDATPARVAGSVVSWGMVLALALLWAWGRRGQRRAGVMSPPQAGNMSI